MHGCLFGKCSTPGGEYPIANIVDGKNGLKKIFKSNGLTATAPVRRGTKGRGIMARNVWLFYSPDEGIWYYQQKDDAGKTSKKTYESKKDALRDYHRTDDPEFEWE